MTLYSLKTKKRFHSYKQESSLARSYSTLSFKKKNHTNALHQKNPSLISKFKWSMALPRTPLKAQSMSHSSSSNSSLSHSRLITIHEPTSKQSSSHRSYTMSHASHSTHPSLLSPSPSLTSSIPSSSSCSSSLISSPTYPYSQLRHPTSHSTFPTTTTPTTSSYFKSPIHTTNSTSHLQSNASSIPYPFFSSSSANISPTPPQKLSFNVSKSVDSSLSTNHNEWMDDQVESEIELLLQSSPTPSFSLPSQPYLLLHNDPSSLKNKPTPTSHSYSHILENQSNYPSSHYYHQQKQQSLNVQALSIPTSPSSSMIYPSIDYNQPSSENQCDTLPSSTLVSSSIPLFKNFNPTCNINTPFTSPISSTLPSISSSLPSHMPHSHSIPLTPSKSNHITLPFTSTSIHSPSNINHYLSNNTHFSYPTVQETVENKSYTPLLPTNSSRSVPVSILPERFRSVFDFPFFNFMQSDCFHEIFETSNNVMVSAPTGSGKTVLLELSLIHLWNTFPTSHAVYLAPTKALCSEKVKAWSTQFNPLGFKVLEFTSDSDYSTLSMLHSSQGQVIVTTPEKWDSFTRKWRSQSSFIKQVKLWMIDEIHLLNDVRGSTLEAVLTRMHLIKLELHHPLRCIGLSATFPNLNDLAQWLKATSFVFNHEYRPVPLTPFVYGYETKNKSPWQFEASLNQYLFNLIQTHAPHQSVLIFCSTRKAAEATALHLKNECPSPLLMTTSPNSSNASNPSSHPFVRNPHILAQLASNLKHTSLKNVVCHGIAFHHAGLDVSDRKLIEQAFLENQVQVICTTSTLAIGVNLPAYLVIVKGTQTWSKTGLTHYSDFDVLQMMGRAGRPQFDQEGKAIIMTSANLVLKYQQLLQGQAPIESDLHHHLLEHLNTEIAQQTIHHLPSAMTWLKHTFLYIRLSFNPSYYQPTLQSIHDLSSLLESQLELLKQANLIQFQNATLQIQSTLFGQAMSQYYCKYETMVTLLKSGFSLPDQLYAICGHHELGMHAHLPNGDKLQLKQLNEVPEIKFKLNLSTYKLKSNQDKFFLILQAILGGSKNLPSLFMHEALMSWPHFFRIIQCMIQIHLAQSQLNPSNFSSLALRCALYLHQSLRTKVWFDSRCSLRQIDKIGPSLAQLLMQHQIYTLDQFLHLEPWKLEQWAHRNPPFGTQLLSSASKLPLLTCELKVHSLPLPTTLSSLQFSFSFQFPNKKKDPLNLRTRSGSPCQLHLLIDSFEDQQFCLFYHQRFSLLNLCTSPSLLITLPSTTTTSSLSSFSKLCISLIFEDFIALDLHYQLDVATLSVLPLTHFHLPESCFTPTFHHQETTSKKEVALTKTQCQHRCKDKLKCAHACCKRWIENVSVNSNPSNFTSLPKDTNTNFSSTSHSASTSSLSFVPESMHETVLSKEDLVCLNDPSFFEDGSTIFMDEVKEIHYEDVPTEFPSTSVLKDSTISLYPNSQGISLESKITKEREDDEDDDFQVDIHLTPPLPPTTTTLNSPRLRGVNSSITLTQISVPSSSPIIVNSSSSPLCASTELPSYSSTTNPMKDLSTRSTSKSYDDIRQSFLNLIQKTKTILLQQALSSSSSSISPLEEYNLLE